MNEWFYPMACSGGTLENALDKGLFDNDEYVGQVKCDGARYLISKDEFGKVKIYSRQISKKTGHPVVKTEQLQHLADEFSKLAPPGTILDGEVCAPTGISSSNHVVSVTGSLPDKAIEKQQKNGFLIFKAFDIIYYAGAELTSEPFHYRKEQLDAVLHGHKGFIHSLGVHYGPDKRELYDACMKEGLEGIILKSLHAPYEQGVRSKLQVKVKRQRSFDVVLMGYETAEEFTIKKGDTEATRSRIAGKVGAIKYGMYMPTSGAAFVGMLSGLSDPSVELQEIGTVSGFDDALRDELTLNGSKYIGKVIELIGQEQFKTGSIRHPRFLRFREDKVAGDCVFQENES